MLKMLIAAAAALAMVTTAEAGAPVHEWKCQATGLQSLGAHSPPRRVQFSGTSKVRQTAASNALNACQTGSGVTSGSCQAGSCKMAWVRTS
jgi:hypothetical protein